MEQQSKRIYDKAIQIYRSEINGISANGNIKTISKTHKQLEEELKKFVQKELKGYSKLNEVNEKLVVRNI